MTPPRTYNLRILNDTLFVRAVNVAGCRGCQQAAVGDDGGHPPHVQGQRVSAGQSSSRL